MALDAGALVLNGKVPAEDVTGHVETQEGRGGLGGDAYEVDGLPRGPRGAVGAGTVTATFYNFNREHVQRYPPAA
ncbi:hypothetical protein ABZ916_15790 [Streptomyces sp. NPDC046853]|uniref:hypothetical protein n=1 Tax=Streptomyces sp. NPDC046853 TaxID=3154920 RepID=UPI0033F9238D